MAISYAGTLAEVEGAATVEEALDFATWLAATPGPRVDLGGASALHSAVLQCLLAARPALIRLPADAFLAACLADLPRAPLGAEPAATP